MKKWVLLCIEGESWPEVASRLSSIAHDLRTQPAPWCVSGCGAYWTGEDNRPNLDAVGAVVDTSIRDGRGMLYQVGKPPMTLAEHYGDESIQIEKRSKALSIEAFEANSGEQHK